MLVSLLQRGLHYAAIEFHLEEDGSERPCARPFTLLEPHVCERATSTGTKTRALSASTAVSTIPTISSSLANLPTQAELHMVLTGKSGDEEPPRAGKKRKKEHNDHQDLKDLVLKDPPPSESESVDTSMPFETNPNNKPKREKKRTTSRDRDRDRVHDRNHHHHHHHHHDHDHDQDQEQNQDQDHDMKKSSNPNSKASKTPKTPKTPKNSSGNSKKDQAQKTTTSRTKKTKVGMEIFPNGSDHLALFEQVKVLTGHSSEVITCAWNPSPDISLLASASGDGTVRLWTIPAEGPWNLEEAQMTMRILDHSPPSRPHPPTTASMDEQGIGSDITTMDWCPDGQVLATGTSDGRVRLWGADGDLLVVLEQHNGPIFQMQWSPDGRHLVSVGLGPAVAVWAMASKSLKAVFDHHLAPALDVDWRDGDTFATCSSDKQVLVYSIGEAALSRSQPLLTLAGHTDEVNSIKWSPDGSLLVSSSDDLTARVWSVAPDCSSFQETLVLAGHTKEIYTAKWSRAPLDHNHLGDSLSDQTATDEGLFKTEPSLRRLWVATASFDGTVKIWDSHSGVCLYQLQHHTQPVYAIDFSPCGRYLASGSLDGALCLWSLGEGGKLIKVHSGHGSIFEVTWSPAGRRIAACASDATLSVLDFE